MSEYLNINFRNGYRNVVDIDVAYRELEKIRQRSGKITPAEVVERAKSKRNPLHREIYRENDSAAAHQWRLSRARHLIASIEVVREEAPHVEARAYEIQKEPLPEQPHRNVYTRTEDILKDPLTRHELLARAMAELAAFRRRYHALSELAQVFHAIDSILVSNAGR